MPEIIINNKNFSIPEVDDNTSINDLLDHIVAQGSSEHEVITAIEVNDQIVEYEQEEAVLISPINSYQKISLHTQSRIELAYDSLDSCDSYLDVVIDKIALVVALYAENKPNEANEHFAEIIGIMELFIQLIGQINVTIKEHFPNSEVKSEDITNLELHLISVLKALVPAKENNDIIMLCDLLEYELVDNLAGWKKEAIPSLKRIWDN